MPKSVDDVRLRTEREREELPSDGEPSESSARGRPRREVEGSEGSGEPGVASEGCEPSVEERVKSNGRRGMGRSRGGLGSSMSRLRRGVAETTVLWLFRRCSFRIALPGGEEAGKAVGLATVAGWPTDRSVTQVCRC